MTWGTFGFLGDSGTSCALALWAAMAALRPFRPICQSWQMVRTVGLEPTRCEPLEPKSSASTSSATLAKAKLSNLGGAPRAIRTPDPQVRSLMLYPAELWARTQTSSLPGRPGRFESRVGNRGLRPRKDRSASKAPGIFGPILPKGRQGGLVQSHASRGTNFGVQGAGDEARIVGTQGAAHARAQHGG